MTLANLAAQLKSANRRGRALPALWLLSDAQRLPDPRAALSRLPPGAGFIFRHYETPGREAQARALRQLCRQRRIKFLLAGDWRMALRLRADGVHLPEYLAHRAAAIRAVNPNAIITAAAHGEAAMHRARRHGANAIFLSPLFATQSHPTARPLGVVRFARLAQQSRIPVIALGGINAANTRRLKGTRTAGVAGVSAIF